MSLETVDEGWPRFEIHNVAITLLSQMQCFNCDIDTAWKDYIHDIIKQQFTLEQVKDYISKEEATNGNSKK